MQPGQLLARGVCRHLHELDFVALTEFVPARGLRVDVMALGPKGDIWIIECKSSRADFQSDHKWQGYLEWCDAFFWAVDADFPVSILPPATGLILADSHYGEIVRSGPGRRVSAARRRALSLKFARQAARQLHRLRDPGAAALFSARRGP